MKERIQKILANAGVASRRNVEQMILDGRVSVNGKVMTELPILVDPARDRIAVDEEPVKLAGKQASKRIYILLNKPKGVVTSNASQGEQLRVIDLLPPGFTERVYPVGQLEQESRGLVLLTNDGELTNQLTHPRYGVPKTYRAVVDGFIQPDSVQELEKGVWMVDPRTKKGYRTGKSHISIVRRTRERSVLDITIREGRNRQVRRILAKLGHKVRDLARIRLGPLKLDKLDPGESRLLTSREVRELTQAAQQRPEKPARKPREEQA